jgi:hypothetical protein
MDFEQFGVALGLTLGTVMDLEGMSASGAADSVREYR